MDKEFRSLLQDRLNRAKEKKEKVVEPQVTESEWTKMTWATAKDFEKSPETGIKEEVINKVGEALTIIPKGFKVLRQIDRLLKNRKEQFFETKELDWASAELLAYGSLLFGWKASALEWSRLSKRNVLP